MCLIINTACSSGTFGKGCSRKCGRCISKPCNHVNGECPNKQCENNYLPPKCLKSKYWFLLIGLNNSKQLFDVEINPVAASPPKLLEVGHTYCTIQINDSYNGEIKPYFYKIQYKV